MSDTAVLRLDEVTRHYRSGDSGFALASTTLDVEPGTLSVITGRSGAGKTTLLQILAALDRPDSGRVWMFGRDVTRAGEAALSEIRRRRLGVVYQRFHFIEHLPVWQNVTSRLVPGGVDAATRRDRATRLLEELDLAGLHDRRPRDLSGGEQQRVALARAIVDEPDVVIADEPTSNVDAETGRLIVDRFETLRAAGKTLVVSTHDPAIVDRADRRYEMEEGRVRP